MTVNTGGGGWSRLSMMGLGAVATVNAGTGHGCHGR